ncbi:MAG TPA: RusA family crossover junction endodeoxyribonuclease [Frankiaceae bacterium]|jgi:Holliday junction resolvase RusA-like endonuclease|nr:RusA family crossover junction endodeoxyribonuclease [Frankiaceae bacterium]
MSVLPLVLPELVIDAVGVPAPQGSKSFKGMRAGKPVLVESSKKVAPWRAAVESAARARMALTGWTTLDGPIELLIVFFLPRPRSVRRVWPTAYPDSSKLLRSTEDALVRAGVVADDARFVHHDVWKRYALEVPGARITVRPVAS